MTRRKLEDSTSESLNFEVFTEVFCGVELFYCVWFIASHRGGRYFSFKQNQFGGDIRTLDLYIVAVPDAGLMALFTLLHGIGEAHRDLVNLA